MFRKIFPLIAGLMLILASCNDKPSEQVRETIPLDGTWRFAMDTSGIGIDKQWFASRLNDSVLLPGTMDENKKGIVNTNTGETMRLSRELMYSGMAWYQKELIIPDKWDGKNISLIMERTKPTKVWVDSAPAGDNSDILTQQVYDLSDFLTRENILLQFLSTMGADRFRGESPVHMPGQSIPRQTGTESSAGSVLKLVTSHTLKKLKPFLTRKQKKF